MFHRRRVVRLPDDVYVATLRAVPGPEVAVEMLAGHLPFVVVSSYTRFAYIIDACPYEVSDHIWKAVDFCPVGESVARIRFGLPYHALGHALMVSFHLMNHIIVADDIVGSRERVVYLPVGVPGGERLSDRAFLRVETPAIIRELIGKLYSALRLTFKNFIAYAPGNNRRMASVAPYERVKILLPPLPYQFRIVVGSLGLFPTVESLVDNEQTD